jgi:alpha(1,3/1,4) fucosyltransferase
MLNVYLDPSSYVYLSNNIFKEGSKYEKDNWLLPWRYLKNYCLENGINVNTIDFWNEKNAADTDVYLSHDHKSLFRRFYWHFKRNKSYPIFFNLKKFKKRILFQIEPPIVMPDVYAKIDNVIKNYDEIYFVSRVGNLKCHRLQIYQTYNKEFPEYWNNSDRKLITLISTNKAPRSFGKLLVQLGSFAGLKYWGYKELFSERIKAVKFFSKYGEMDLYGNGWDKRPFFPYWFYKESIQKAYRGLAGDRHKTLSGYKFAIAFENCIVPGFITERIFDCFYSGTIPVYLGAPDITDYVPKECFIDMRDFKNYDELRAFMKSLSSSEIENYRQNGRKFLSSDKFKIFSKEYFAETFVRAVKDNI